MKRIIVFILINTLLVLSATAGGGWPQKKGNGYYKLSALSIRGDSHYTDEGLIDPNITSGVFTLSLYGEYGITDRFTLMAYVPFFTRAYSNNLVSMTTGEVIVEGDVLNSFGDTDIGLKYGIVVDKPVALAGTIMVGVPFGVDNGNPNNYLQTGDMEGNMLFQLDVGTSFGSDKVAAYANAHAGINVRTGGYSEEFRYGFEAGMGLFNRKLWLIGRVTGVESFLNGDTAADANGATIFSNNSEFTSPSVELAYYITKKVGISANYAGAFRGSLIIAAPSYSVGVFMDLKK